MYTVRNKIVCFCDNVYYYEYKCVCSTIMYTVKNIIVLVI